MDETRAHARSRTGSHRVRGGCSTIEKHGHDRTRVTRAGSELRERSRLRRVFARVERPWFWLAVRGMRVGPLPIGRELQREESNLRDDRLTGGCLTIRLRWNAPAPSGADCWARRAAWSKVPRERGRASGASFQRARAASVRARVAWFRAQGSNLRFWIQRPVSCLLDDPGESERRRRGTHVAGDRGERPRRSHDAAVGPGGIEPPPPRLRVECACLLRYGPERRVGLPRVGGMNRGVPKTSRGTRGSRTLIPRGKSPVLGQIELASRGWMKRTAFVTRSTALDTELEKHD